MTLYPRLMLMGLALTSSLGANANPWRDLYGEGLMFDVFRDGKPVGHYETQFIGNGDNWRVDARLELEVTWLFWRYRYGYHGVEAWKDGTLERLDVRIDDNGDLLEHRFERDGSRLTSTSGVKVELPVLATHHYDVSVVDDARVINTLTGELSRVEVERSGPAPFHAAGRTLQAVSYRYLGDGEGEAGALAGDLTGTRAWYDLQGRWVGLEFTDSSGATVELRCQRCGVTSAGGNRDE